jgi:hypothetical protein
MSKILYKDWTITFSGFTWEIKFLDVESENFGETNTDQKYIYIYTKGRSKQNIVETIVHELQHVILFDMAEAIFHFDSENVGKKEENGIRLTSPRMYEMIKSNKAFFKWLLSQF